MNAKATFFAGVAVTAIAATAMHFCPNLVAASAANGLKCEISELTKNGELPPETKNMTWVLQLLGDSWEWVSLNGLPAKEVFGKRADGKDPIRTPLRTTSQTYVLMEEDKHKSGTMTVDNSPLVVDRTTGEMFGIMNTWNTHWHMEVTTSGHCEPVRIQANL
jgi:hypothetical protein